MSVCSVVFVFFTTVYPQGSATRCVTIAFSCHNQNLGDDKILKILLCVGYSTLTLFICIFVSKTFWSHLTQNGFFLLYGVSKVELNSSLVQIFIVCQNSITYNFWFDRSFHLIVDGRNHKNILFLFQWKFIELFRFEI